LIVAASPITYGQAILLGLVQGVTELFPISSLGHSVIRIRRGTGCLSGRDLASGAGPAHAVIPPIPTYSHPRKVAELRFARRGGD